MEITSTEIFKHESYNPFLIHNDIALIHLPQPIEFNGSSYITCINPLLPVGRYINMDPSPSGLLITGI